MAFHPLSRRTLTLMLLSAVPASGAVWAQTSADDNSSLDTVTVTGEATAYGDTPPPAFAGGQVAAGGRVGLLGEQDAMDVPYNVISYTSELSDNQQAETVGDVLRNDASVDVGSGFGIYGESFKIRGFNLFGDDLSYGGLYGVLPRQIVSSDIADRVELFKGASAFANGMPPGGTGVGGSVNLEPKRAPDEGMLELSTGYTSEGAATVGVDAGRRFGDQNQFGARVSVERGRGNTAIDDEENRHTSAVVGLDYQGERGRASLDIGHQRNVVEGGRNIVSVGGLTDVPDAPDAETNYAPEWAGTELETTFAMLRGEYDLSADWTGYAAIGGNETSESIVSANPAVNNQNGDATIGPMDTRNDISSFSSQMGFRGDVDTGGVSHQLNLGYSNSYRRYDTEFDFFSGYTTNIYRPQALAEPTAEQWQAGSSGGSIQRFRSEGISVSDTLGFLDDSVLLTVGARYQDLESNDGSGNGVNEESQVSPHYGVVVKPWEGVSLYANHVEGLQDGGVVSPFDGGSNVGESLGIVEATQDEIGAKFDYGRIGGGVSLFQIEQPSGTVNSAGEYSLDNEQRNRGIEVNLYGEPIPSVRLLSSAAWTTPELTKTVNEEERGNETPGVSSYRYVVGGEWDLPNLPNVTATSRVIHNGPQYVDNANQLEIDAWTRLDLGLRYAMPMADKELIWRFNVDNVTNEDYWSSASTTSAGYLYQGEPRTFKLSATLDF